MQGAVRKTNIRLRTLAKSGAWLEAWMLLEKSASARDLISYNTVLTGCEKAKQWQAALHLLSTMLRRQVEPCAISYGATLSAISKAKEWERSLDLFRRIPAPYVNSITYNCVLNGMSLTGKWQRALQLFDEMGDADPCTSHEGTSVPRSSATYPTVITALARASRWQLALNIFRQIPADMMTAYCYGSILNAMEKSKKPEWALALYSELVRREMPMNEGEMTIATNSMLSALEKTRRWRLALEMFEKHAGQTFTPNLYSYNALLSAFDKGKRWSLALKYFHQMSEQEIHPDTISYNVLISAHRFQSKRILKLLKQMQDAHIEATVITYTAALQGMCNTTQQVKVLALMKEASIAPNSLTYFMVKDNPLIDVSSWDYASLIDWKHDDAQAHCAALVGDLTDSGIQVPATLHDQYDTRIFRPLIHRIRTGTADVERVTTLGGLKTRSVLEQLGVAWPDDSYFARARAQGLVHTPAGALSAAKVQAYAEFDVQLGAKELVGSEMFNYEKEARSQSFPRLGLSFAQHDRNTHAERLALESLARRLIPAAKGSVTLVADHILCVGCIAAVGRFRRLFPTVTLSVGFLSCI